MLFECPHGVSMWLKRLLFIYPFCFIHILSLLNSVSSHIKVSIYLTDNLLQGIFPCKKEQSYSHCQQLFFKGKAIFLSWLHKTVINSSHQPVAANTKKSLIVWNPLGLLKPTFLNLSEFPEPRLDFQRSFNLLFCLLHYFKRPLNKLGLFSPLAMGHQER